MIEDLQNTAFGTVEDTETVAEQGTVVDDTVDTTDKVETAPVVETEEDKEAQKAKMRENQLKNIETQAKELEQKTGLSLEDLLSATQSNEDDEVVADTAGIPDDIDKELFDKLVDARFEEKYSSRLKQIDKFEQYARKIEAKETVSKLPSDYKDYEHDIVDILLANPILSSQDNGVETAYYAAKGKRSGEISDKAVANKEKEINEKEEVKKVAFVENSKSDKEVNVGKNIEDYMNLSNDEFGKLPKDIREQILRSL